MVTISLWFMAWTPYLVINWLGVFESTLMTPLTTIWGSVFAKANAVYNPIVYGISHPKYREALSQRHPWLCGVNANKPQSDATSNATNADSSVSADEIA